MSFESSSGVNSAPAGDFEDCILARMIANRTQDADPAIYENLVGEMMERRSDRGYLLCRYVGCDVSCIVQNTGSVVRPIDTVGDCLQNYFGDAG